MIQELPEGQTHSFNDGCGEGEHNDKKLMKKGDKIWILLGGSYCEAEVLSLPSNGKLVEYRISFNGARITPLAKLCRAYTVFIEKYDEFNARRA